MSKPNYSELEELKKLVKKLDHIEGKDNAANRERIQVLKEIEKALLNDYIIVIGAFKIEPLLVEAYYYHTEKFEDPSVYAAKESNTLARERQKNHFGELYVHPGTKDGFDIVLSLSDNYYLSFLIKNALVNGEWKSQCAISQAICEHCDGYGICKKGHNCKYYNAPVLKKRIESKNSKIVYLPRKGISGCFADQPLAALPLEEILKYEFTLPKGYGKQWRMWKLVVYALTENNKNEKEARKYIKENGFYDDSNYKDSNYETIWVIAKEALHIEP